MLISYRLFTLIIVHRRRLHSKGNPSLWRGALSLDFPWTVTNLILFQFAFRLKDEITLLDVTDISIRRRAGIVFTILKSNHYKFP